MDNLTAEQIKFKKRYKRLFRKDIKLFEEYTLQEQLEIEDEIYRNIEEMEIYNS